VQGIEFECPSVGVTRLAVPTELGQRFAEAVERIHLVRKHVENFAIELSSLVPAILHRQGDCLFRLGALLAQPVLSGERSHTPPRTGVQRRVGHAGTTKTWGTRRGTAQSSSRSVCLQSQCPHADQASTLRLSPRWRVWNGAAPVWCEVFLSALERLGARCEWPPNVRRPLARARTWRSPAGQARPCRVKSFGDTRSLVSNRFDNAGRLL